ncbi:MAG TPA: glycosyltransferase family 4 protein [Thermoplasmata archaeon]|nr:glycosyltransferase family 4 protein [Thermoplasmata archaeon]
MEKLKIAMLTTTFFPQVGGAEHSVKWLAEELAKRGHEVYLFTPYEANEFIEKNEKGFPKNISLRKGSANSFSDAFRMIYRFTKTIKRIKPDIVHAHYAFSAGFLAVITKPIHKAPVVITSRGEDIQLNREIGYGMRNSRSKSILVRFALRNCDKHVLISNSLKKDALESGSKEKKMQTIYNMYVPPRIKITEKDIENLKKKYMIPFDKKIILSVSRLHPKKGLNYLIEAMAKVLRKHPDAFLVIAGEGEERQRLEKLVKDENLECKVKFTGLVMGRDKLALIKGCDVFCMPSIEEAFGIALFEPMYYSKPIVATNVGGIPEVLGEKYGYIVEKENSQSLSTAIYKLLLNDNERLRVGDNINIRLRMFLPDNIVVEYEGLYKSCLE